jgi:hypothetical protein
MQKQLLFPTDLSIDFSAIVTTCRPPFSIRFAMTVCPLSCNNSSAVEEIFIKFLVGEWY